MDNDKQRIAIAEACGWRIPPPMTTLCGWAEPDGTKMLSDPLTDLNAMHEAEKVLTWKQGVEFARQLYAVIDAPLEKHPELGEALGLLQDVEIAAELLKATAAQRAEAFLRTVGKWEDSALSKS